MQEFNRGRKPETRCVDVGMPLRKRAPLHEHVTTEMVETRRKVLPLSDSDLGIDVAEMTTEAQVIGGLADLGEHIAQLRAQRRAAHERLDEAALQYEQTRFKKPTLTTDNPQAINMQVNLRPDRLPYFAR